MQHVASISNLAAIFQTKVGKSSIPHNHINAATDMHSCNLIIPSKPIGVKM